jgi:hypothetical protein
VHPGVAKNLAPYERVDITSEVDGQTSARSWRVVGISPRMGGVLELDLRQYSGTALSAATSDDTISSGGPELSEDVSRFMYAGNIEDGNYVSIDTSGNLSLVGDATVWEDLRFAAQDLGRLGNSDPGFVMVADSDGEGGSTGVFGLGFDNNTLQEVVFAVQFPHEWKESSDVTFHDHWSPNTGTGSLEKGVVWALEYSWANIGIIDGTGTPVAFGNTTTIYATDIDTFTEKEHRMVNFSAIDGDGKKISSMMLCRLYRSVNSSSDDYADDAILLEADFHFEIDAMGSKTISAK